MASGAARAGTDRIGEAAPACVVAGRYPILRFRPASSAGIVRARLYFRAENQSDWYFVAMRSDMPGYVATLPRPKRSVRTIHYFVEVVTAGAETTRTAAGELRVTADAAACGGLPLTSSADNAAVVLGSPAGSAPLPPGFEPALGGRGRGLWPVVGASVVGGGVAMASAARSGKSADTATTTSPPATTMTPATTPSTTSPPATQPAPTQPPATHPPSTQVPAPTPGPPPPPQCADTTSPNTRVTDPTGGTITSSPVSVEASATDNVGVTRVEFYYHIDQRPVTYDPPTLFGVSESPPYRVGWSVPALCGAVISLRTFAYDSCGNVGDSPAVSVSVMICNKP